MLTPSNLLCTWPLSVPGDSTPSASRIVGTMSMAWWYWWRSSPRPAALPAAADGSEMMHGSAVPPLNSYRFHILNGVLKAIAQPLG